MKNKIIIINLTLVVIMAILLLIATTAPAHASILSSARDWVFNNVIGILLTSAFTLIAGFFGGTTWGKVLLKAKIPIWELKDVAVRVHEARRPSSPGGKDVTSAEKDAILKEVEELIQAIVATFGKGK